VSTKVTRLAVTKVGVILISNRLCDQPFVDRSAFSPPLQHLRITFKDRRLFELGNSFSGRWPIADFLNRGSSTTGSASGLGPAKERMVRSTPSWCISCGAVGS
jgi:hypothetical protein